MPEPKATMANQASAAPRPPRAVRAAGLLLGVAVAAVYANSLGTPFVFDDALSIADNPTIRQLGRIGTVLSPPRAGSVCARPLVNLSLALNYAVSGLNPWSYHALNLVVHAGAALLLFGLVRRTLAGRWGTFAAWAAALLWALHPLQTESVTFVIQRTESLMGFFYLLTLYAFVRAVRESSRAWALGCVLACLAGMATKEVMVSAPLLVLLYDRTFLAGSFRAAWARRRPVYLCLAATWGLLAYCLVASGGDRAGAAGFHAGVSWQAYLLTQCEAIVHYLHLAFWPHPLVVDYGERLAGGWGEAALPACLLLVLAGGTLAALRFRPAWGFLGVWFFAILAPSSSVVPLPTQTVAEHRMYLPLAAIAVGLVGLLRRGGGRAGLIAATGLAVAGGALTVARNHDYRTEVALWTDTVARVPDNPRAHYNLGVALDQAGQIPEAVRQYREAIRLKPTYVEAHNNLGNVLQRTGHPPEAVAEIGEAVRLGPPDPRALYNLGNALFAAGRPEAAIAAFGAALALKPDYAEAHCNLGVALTALGRTGDALAEYRAAAAADPRYAVAQFDWGNALAQAGRIPEAIPHYEATLRLDPRQPGAEANLANALLATGQLPAALGHYEAALALQPGNARVRYNLGNALRQAGRNREAADQYAAALRLQPQFPEARAALAAIAGASAP
jgi:tetratricopeptide (TPR) repeat protein